jgi:putative spermidine/putrescine transport system permease protein
MASLTGTRKRSTGRGLILAAIGAYLLLPLIAMVEFSTRGAGSTPSLDAWKAVGTNSDLVVAITVSVELAVLTVVGMLVLLVPTMTWVHLRLPRMRRVVEFICLLPLAIPAIVLVVGMAPIYAWVNYLIGNSPLTLVFVYVVLVLPYAYRALDAGLGAIDLTTLAEAARNLGSSWFTVLVRIVVPNILGSITSAAVISVALVLGEFTVSSLLSFETLQVVINLLGKRDAAVSVAVSLAALVFGFVLLYAVGHVAPRRRAAVPEESRTRGST